MTIYHGSNVEVREPKILPPDRELDFGNGFYTTTNLDQAIAFARRVTRNRGIGAATVSVYEIDEGVAQLRNMENGEQSEVQLDTFTL